MRTLVSIQQTPLMNKRKLVCQCGWKDKTFANQARSHCRDHIEKEHGGVGAIHEHNNVILFVDGT